MLCTHILVNFDAEPPAIFCTRRARSSPFSSDSCFAKSFLDLENPHRQHAANTSLQTHNALGLEFVGLDFAGHLEDDLWAWRMLRTAMVSVGLEGEICTVLQPLRWLGAVGVSHEVLMSADWRRCWPLVGIDPERVLAPHTRLRRVS